MYFPLLLSHTLMFNIVSQISALLQLIPKASLTTDEINECKAALYAIISMETKGTPLGSGVSFLRKGVKREDLYKLLWREIEYFIGCYANTDGHKAVLQCLYELHGEATSILASTEDKMAVDEQSNGIGSLATGVIVKKELGLNGSKSEDKETKSKKIKMESNVAQSSGNGNEKSSLLDIWVKKLEDRKRLDFVGRATAVTPLYVHLNEENKEGKEEKS